MVVPAFSAGERPSASKLQQLATYLEYQPTLTGASSDPALGTSPTRTGIVWVTGQLITVWFRIGFGSSPSVGSGAYLIGLPPDLPAADILPTDTVGTCRLVDASTTAERRGWLTLTSDRDKVALHTDEGSLVTHAAPWTWAAGDTLGGTFTYLTDFNI